MKVKAYEVLGRVSTVEDQEARLREDVEQEGGQVVRVFVDDGTSEEATERITDEVERMLRTKEADSPAASR